MKTGLYAAVAILCAAAVPRLAEILGFHLAGFVWGSLQLTSPLLVPVGEVVAGVVAGLVIGGLQTPFLRPRRVVLPATQAGAAVGLAAAIYWPLAVLVAPIAAGIAAAAQARQQRFIRAHSIAAAWAGLALALPFPQLVRGLFFVGSGLVAAWGLAGLSAAQQPRETV